MTSSTVKTVFLLRHTETVWNSQSRYQGRLDTDLSARGLADLNLIAAQAAPGEFVTIHSSPLRRALALAEAIQARVECPLAIDERITEIAMGPWEGLTRAEIQERFPDMFATWQDRSDEVAFPGGESLQDVAARVGSLLDEVFAGSADRVLVVTHDAVVKVAVMLALGTSFSHLHRFRMRNGSVSVLRGRVLLGSLDSMDSVSHLTRSPFRLPG